jgi:hypothetical protein
MDKDLNIDNYDFNDLLSVFKITEPPLKLQIEKKGKKMTDIENKYAPSISIFYKKVFVILSCLGELMDQSFILNMEDDENIYIYIQKIKEVDDYHTKDINELIHIFTNQSFLLNKKETGGILQMNYNPNNLFYNSNKNTNNPNASQVINSYPNPVADGTVNYLKRMVQLTNLHLNSCFRENYYKSNPCDFFYTLPTSIQNTISIQLSSIELPNAWYLFSSVKANNVMKIQINRDTAVVYEIVIPDGNYDITSLPHYLNTTYFYLSDTETDLQYIKISINPNNGKTTICSEDCDMTFSVYFNESINANIMQCLGWMLGFRLANYLNMTSIVSEGLYDGGGDRYIYVSVEDFQNNVNENNIVCFDRSILNQHVIAKIPLINGKFSITSNDYNGLSLSKIRKYNGPVNIRRLHIKLLDKYGEVIDLNNMDYSITFELELLYENMNAL